MGVEAKRFSLGIVPAYKGDAFGSQLKAVEEEMDERDRQIPQEKRVGSIEELRQRYPEYRQTERIEVV